jgi:hypothetical protein
MALKAPYCSGNDASPQNWSVLRAIHTLNSPKKIYPLAWGVVAHPFNNLAWSAKPHVRHEGAISAGGGHGRLWLCWLMLAVGGCSQIYLL